MAQRRAEQLVREHAWQQSQVERLAAEVAGIGDLLGRLDDRSSSWRAGWSRALRAPPARTSAVSRSHGCERGATSSGSVRRRCHARRTHDEARRRAEISLALDEARVRDLDAEVRRVGERDTELGQRGASS